MKTIEKIRLLLKETKSQGHDAINIHAFENYLTSIENEIGEDAQYASMNLERDLALFKAENDRNIAHANNLTASSLEMFRSVISSGQAALKASMVINGGASVALLAFMGKIWSSEITNAVASKLSTSIFLFCIGLLCAALSSGTTYITQLFYNKQKEKLGTWINGLTIVLVLLSYLIFIVSAFIAAASFGMHFGL